MDEVELRKWRRGERERLIALRRAVPAETIQAWRLRIDATLEGHFAPAPGAVVAFCWPIQNEYDARHVVARMRPRGVVTALPVVVAPRTPLVFREWHPGVPLDRGVYDIPFPAEGPAIEPDLYLVPMNGFDPAGYRLGYGGGFFDRTLAARLGNAALPRPTVVGIAYEIQRMPTIHPASYDVPMDYVVTEAGIAVGPRK